MLQYLKENKHVIMVAVTLFVISMSSVFFFFGSNNDLAHKDLKTDISASHGTIESINLKALQEKEKKYRKLINNQEDTIFVMSVDGNITFTSWNVENAIGYKQEELNHKSFYTMIHADDLSGFFAAFGQVIKNKKSVSNVGPYRMRNAAGEYHMHIASLMPILSHGNIDEIIIASKDITEASKEHTGKKIMNEMENATARFLADRPAGSRSP